MAVRVYKSTDSSAPVLTGQAGSLIAVLDACLVNGFGTQTGSGWSKAFTGTNIAAYRMDTAAPATGSYIRVDDSGNTHARVIGYETMSSADLGDGPFPTNIQQSGGMFIRKSQSADSVQRPWMVIADTRAFYVFCFANQTAFGTTDVNDGQLFFGDIASYKNPDSYSAMIIGADNTGARNALGRTSNNGYSNLFGHFMARPYTGLGTCVQVMKLRRGPQMFSANGGVIGIGSSGHYPDPVTGKIVLFDFEIIESDQHVYRGKFPGLYEPKGGTLVGNNFAVFSGEGSLSSTTFMLIPVYDTSNTGRAAIQISGSWFNSSTTSPAPAGVSGRYFRIVSSANNGSLYTSLAEMFLVFNNTDLVTAGKTYSASTNLSGYLPQYAFDGVINTNSNYWAADRADTSPTLMIDMGSVVSVDRIDLALGPAAGIQEAPRDFIIQYSTNGTTWTTCSTQTNQTDWQFGVRKQYPLA